MKLGDFYIFYVINVDDRGPTPSMLEAAKSQIKEIEKLTPAGIIFNVRVSSKTALKYIASNRRLKVIERLRAIIGA